MLEEVGEGNSESKERSGEKLERVKYGDEGTFATSLIIRRLRLS